MTEPGIKKGGFVHCGRCGAHILTATRDIKPCSEIQSADFTRPDGTPLPFRAIMVCTACGHLYSTISTTTARTD